MIRKGQPMLVKLISSHAYTPFYHLFFGISFKLLLVILYFKLAHKITGSNLAACFAVCLMFGVAFLKLGDYQILNLRFPTGFSSNEFRLPGYLSFRQLGMICALSAILCFLKRQYFLCAFLIGIATHSHSQNSINFFLSFCTALFLCLAIKKRKKDIN